MLRTKLTLAFLGMGLVSCGCVNSVRPLTGTIGPLKLYRATAQSFSGPNITQIWACDGTNAPINAFSASGDGIGHPIIKAVGNVASVVGGAAVLGTTLRPATTKVDASSHAETFSQGGEVVLGR